MRFKCPFCSFIIKPDDAYRGYQVKCPSCEKNVLVPVSPFEEGCIIGDFIIEGKIGKGSIGSVYRATQISLDRKVALKILSPEYTNAKGIKDFLKEARAAAKLSHTNIVQAFAVGEEDGTCYMAMNYITGVTLKDKLKRDGKTPVDEALHIVQQVAEALYYAWDEARLIHRDVKPDNIMITDEGIVKLTDLGLAMHQKEWREDMEISGSPSYMSPEQFSGEKLDSRSDIYSLGITLYQMLSGKLPFEGETLRTVATQHFEEEAQPLNKLDPKIPPRVASLVKKMIAKLPDERFKTMEDLLNKIWTIRQKTAPNKDLVPDVHTISINRLDYDFQNTTKKENDEAKIRAVERAGKERANKFKRLAVLFAFISIALLITVIILALKKPPVNERLQKRVQAFGYQVKSGNSAFRELEITGKRLLKELESPQTSQEKELKALTAAYLSNLEANKLKLRYETLAGDYREQIKKLKGLKEQIYKLKLQKRTETNQTLAKYHNTASELESLKSQNRSYQKKFDRLNAKIKSLEKSNKSESEKILNQKMYSYMLKGTPKQVAMLIKTEAYSHPGQNEKLYQNKIKWLEKLNTIYQAITNSGTKFSGVPIDEENKIVMIEAGEVHYNSSGAIKTAKWTDLPLETTLQLARNALELPPEKSKDTPAGKQKELEIDANLKADIALLKGNLGLALKQNPTDKNVTDICNAVLEQRLNKIRYMATIDKQKAKAKLKLLLKQLEGTEISNKIKTDFNDVLAEETDFWNEELGK